MLDEVASSLFRPSKLVSKSMFEASLESGKNRSVFR